MRRLLILALMPLLAAGGGQSVINTGNHRRTFTPSGCSAPSGLSDEWMLDAAGVTCNGGGACSNGLGIDFVPAQVGTTTLSQSTSGNRPIYTTSAIGTHAAGNWNGSSTQLAMSASVTDNTTTTLFAVIRIATGGSGPIIGNHTLSGQLEWRINSTGHQELLKALVASIGTSTGTYAANTNYAIMVQYNQPTGAYAFYNCSSGTCTLDGSGTSAQTFSTGDDSVGFMNTDGPFKGFIGEVNRQRSITTAGYGAWAQCHWGI